MVSAMLMRPFIMAMILVVGGSAVRWYVDRTVRLDASSMEYIEDSKHGNGTRYRVLTRTEDTSNTSITMELLVRGTAHSWYKGYAGSTPAHVHQGSAETLRVVSGVAGYRYTEGGKAIAGRLEAGDSVVIPAGCPHWWANAYNSTDLLLEVTHTPPGPLGEAWWESLAALGQEAGSADRVHPMQVMLTYWEGDSRIVDLPPILNPLVERVFVPLARLMGFSATYPSHRSAGGAPATETSSEGSSIVEAEEGGDDSQAPYEEDDSHSEL